MKNTNALPLNAAGEIARYAQCILFFAATLTAQAQYLETASTGSVNAQSGTGVWSICADFNNNGTDDVFYVDANVPWCSVILDLGVNGFSSAATGSLSFAGGPLGGASSGFAAELTGDSNIDLVLVYYSDGIAVLYPGLGTGAFAVSFATILPVTLPQAVVALDVNANGVLDIAALQGGNIFSLNLVCLLNQYPTWTALPTQIMYGAVNISYSGDCDGDGNSDLLLDRRNGGQQESTIIWGNGNGTFTPLLPYGTSTLPYYTPPAYCTPVARWVGDANADGRDDVLVDQRCQTTWQENIYYGNTNRTFTLGASFTLPAVYGAMGAYVGSSSLHDMDLDGNLDLVCNPTIFQVNTMQTAWLSQAHLLIARGVGNGQFHPIPFVTTAPQITNTFGLAFPRFHVSDFDNDGDPDVLAPNISAPQQFYFRNRSSVGTGCPGTLAVPLLNHGIAAVGNSLHSLNVSGAVPNAAAVIAVSLGISTSPFNTCGVYLDTLGSTAYLPGTTNALGNFAWPLPIPNNPLLHGVAFYAQAAVLDPLGPNLGGLNLALTPARTIIVW